MGEANERCLDMIGSFCDTFRLFLLCSFPQEQRWRFESPTPAPLDTVKKRRWPPCMYLGVFLLPSSLFPSESRQEEDLGYNQAKVCHLWSWNDVTAFSPLVLLY